MATRENAGLIAVWPRSVLSLVHPRELCRAAPTPSKNIRSGGQVVQSWRAPSKYCNMIDAESRTRLECGGFADDADLDMRIRSLLHDLIGRWTTSLCIASGRCCACASTNAWSTCSGCWACNTEEQHSCAIRRDGHQQGARHHGRTPAARARRGQPARTDPNAPSLIITPPAPIPHRKVCKRRARGSP